MRLVVQNLNFQFVVDISGVKNLQIGAKGPTKVLRLLWQGIISLWLRLV